MLVNLIVGLAILGVVLWLINTYVPMDDRIKQLISIVAVVGAALWALQAFGITVTTGGPIVALIVTLVVLGVVLWVINTYLPIDGKIKQIINVVAMLLAVLVVLQAFGIIHTNVGMTGAEERPIRHLTSK
ncbi:MAG TPA: Thivi_2564 family membrane protein [Planctomycetota bacterium]|jgi:hypothetical protein